jgi:hypothetical protein
MLHKWKEVKMEEYYDEMEIHLFDIMVGQKTIYIYPDGLWIQQVLLMIQWICFRYYDLTLARGQNFIVMESNFQYLMREMEISENYGLVELYQVD